MTEYNFKDVPMIPSGLSFGEEEKQEVGKLFPISLIDENDKDVNKVIGDLNNELAESVFDYIRSIGFTPIDIEKGDTYFVFSNHNNSIVNFRIKELWGKFLFGMWIHSELLLEDKDRGYPVISFFCQYETNIDKFKPSHSGLLVEASREDVMNWLVNDGWFEFQYDVRNLLIHIKQHPFMAYSCDSCGDYVVGRPVKEFIKYESENLFEEIKKEAYYWFYLQFAKSKIEEFNKYGCVDGCWFIVDKHCNPMIKFVVSFDETSSEEEINNCVYSVLPKKDTFGEYRTYDNVLEFEYRIGDKYYTFY